MPYRDFLFSRKVNCYFPNFALRNKIRMLTKIGQGIMV